MMEPGKQGLLEKVGATMLALLEDLEMLSSEAAASNRDTVEKADAALKLAQALESLGRTHNSLHYEVEAAEAVEEAVQRWEDTEVDEE